MRDRVAAQMRRWIPQRSSSTPLLEDFRIKRIALKGGIAVLLVVALYYPLGMALTHRISDDIDFQAGPRDWVEGGSHAVSIATALIDREIDENRWVANDPWFLAPAALDNMPNFQQGIIRAIGRFAFELVDQIGRTRGSSQTDPDLQEASGQLQYAGDVWIFDLSTSYIPTTPSESRYRKARRSLQAYNRRLAGGGAKFERRNDNLLATLDRIALDLGASSATLDSHIEQYSGRLIDTLADDHFYGIKGQTYAYYLLLRELGRDFETVIAARELTAAWEEMLGSLGSAAALSPLVIVNGAPDSQVLPSHLASQGFYLLRARAKLREITNILLK